MRRVKIEKRKKTEKEKKNQTESRRTVIKMISLALLCVFLSLLRALTAAGMDLGGFHVEIGTGEFQEGSSWEQPEVQPPDNNPGYTEPFQPPWGSSESVFEEENQTGQENYFGNTGEIWQPPIQRPGAFPPGNSVPPAYQAAPYEPPGPSQTTLPAPEPEPTEIPAVTITPTPSPEPSPVPVKKRETRKKRRLPTPTPAAEKPYRYYRTGEGNRKKEKRNAEEYIIKKFSYQIEKPVKQAKIKVSSDGEMEIFSLRLNGKETSWQWKENGIILDTEDIPGDSEIQMLALVRADQDIQTTSFCP